MHETLPRTCSWTKAEMRRTVTWKHVLLWSVRRDVERQLLPVGFRSRCLRWRMENKHLPEWKPEQHDYDAQCQTHDCGLQVNARVLWWPLSGLSLPLETIEWMLFVAAWESRDLSARAELGLGIFYTVYMSSKRMVLERRWRIKVELRKTLSYGYRLAKTISTNLRDDRWKIWKDQKEQQCGTNKEAIRETGLRLCGTWTRFIPRTRRRLTDWTLSSVSRKNTLTKNKCIWLCILK